MITVSGQLIDQLRAMKDLMSSLLMNASNLVISYLKNCYFLLPLPPQRLCRHREQAENQADLLRFINRQGDREAAEGALERNL
jgi:hypothetical protein